MPSNIPDWISVAVRQSGGSHPRQRGHPCLTCPWELSPFCSATSKTPPTSSSIWATAMPMCWLTIGDCCVPPSRRWAATRSTPPETGFSPSSTALRTPSRQLWRRSVQSSPVPGRKACLYVCAWGCVRASRPSLPVAMSAWTSIGPHASALPGTEGKFSSPTQLATSMRAGMKENRFAPLSSIAVRYLGRQRIGIVLSGGRQAQTGRMGGD
jgi:hypothetical protein